VAPAATWIRFKTGPCSVCAPSAVTHTWRRSAQSKDTTGHETRLGKAIMSKGQDCEDCAELSSRSSSSCMSLSSAAAPVLLRCRYLSKQREASYEQQL
jgi:hypothetical protein